MLLAAAVTAAILRDLRHVLQIFLQNIHQIESSYSANYIYKSIFCVLNVCIYLSLMFFISILFF